MNSKCTALGYLEMFWHTELLVTSSALVHLTVRLAFSIKERDAGDPFIVNLGLTITLKKISISITFKFYE
jgi:hypothetical protein